MNQTIVIIVMCDKYSEFLLLLRYLSYLIIKFMIDTHSEILFLIIYLSYLVIYEHLKKLLIYF